MKKIITAVTAVSFLFPVIILARPCFGYRPDWESADERSTIEIALADFNGDGWQNVTGETKTGDGQRHVFYLEHFPALTVTVVRVNGTPVPRADYCFDARAGWFSIKNAPANGARVEVNYKWSSRLDFFAGNETRGQTDNRDVIYFNRDGALEKAPSWLSTAREETWTVKEADFDADGDVDVAIGGDAFIKIYKNTGTGLEGTPSWGTTITGGGAGEFAWGDVDNDGYLELAVCDGTLGQFYVYMNTAGTLESTPSWSAAYKYASDVAWGDVDADGDMDLAGATSAGVGQEIGYVYVFRNNNGILAGTPCWKNDPPAGRCSALAWGDVNDDGWLDLVKGIFSYGPGLDPYEDIYYSERGVLPTTPSWESEASDYCFYSYLVDADGDGGLDLIQAVGSGVVGYFRKAGDFEKYPSWSYAPGPPWSIMDIRLGDVNGDGYPDLVASCHATTAGGRNKLFLNKGNIGINVKGFAASPCARGVALRWEVNEAVAGFNLLREVKSAEAAAEPGKINKDLITGRTPYRYLDTAVEAGNTYCYWLDVVPLSGPTERHGPAECTAGVKTSFALAQNAPNPARTTTTFAFSVPAACDATLAVYDIAGRKVATPYAGRAKAGANEVAVDVSTLAPGVYTYRLEAAGASAAKRMVVVR